MSNSSLVGTSILEALNQLLNVTNSKVESAFMAKGAGSNLRKEKYQALATQTSIDLINHMIENIQAGQSIREQELEQFISAKVDEKLPQMPARSSTTPTPATKSTLEPEVAAANAQESVGAIEDYQAKLKALKDKLYEGLSKLSELSLAQRSAVALDLTKAVEHLYRTNISLIGNVDSIANFLFNKIESPISLDEKSHLVGFACTIIEKSIRQHAPQDEATKEAQAELTEFFEQPNGSEHAARSPQPALAKQQPQGLAQSAPQAPAQQNKPNFFYEEEDEQYDAQSQANMTSANPAKQATQSAQSAQASAHAPTKQDQPATIITSTTPRPSYAGYNQSYAPKSTGAQNPQTAQSARQAAQAPAHAPTKQPQPAGTSPSAANKGVTLPELSEQAKKTKYSLHSAQASMQKAQQAASVAAPQQTPAQAAAQAPAPAQAPVKKPPLATVTPPPANFADYVNQFNSLKPQSFSALKDQPAPASEKFLISNTFNNAASPLTISEVPHAGSDVIAKQGSTSLRIALLKTIGKGEYSNVYQTNVTGMVAKIFHPNHLNTTVLEKLKLMTSKLNSTDSICLPSCLLYNNRDEFVGYLMPEAHGYSLASLFNPRRLKQVFPTWTQADRETLCISILERIKYLNDRNIILGYISPKNILVNSPTEVYFISTDTYQVEGYPCPVSHKEYTAPEIQGKFFPEFLRTKGHERFALAVLLFKIMMIGKHPYSIVGGDSLSENIKAAKFAYVPNSLEQGLIPEGPWLSLWAKMRPVQQQAFYDIFHKNGRNHSEHLRLSCDNWLDLLRS